MSSNMIDNLATREDIDESVASTNDGIVVRSHRPIRATGEDNVPELLDPSFERGANHTHDTSHLHLVVSVEHGFEGHLFVEAVTGTWDGVLSP